MERYVKISFVLAGILAWVTIAALVSMVLGFIGPTMDRPLIGIHFTISDLVGFIAGIATAGVLLTHEAANKFGLEVANELRNVTWPTWPETRVSTVVVIATTVVVAAILALFDAVWGMVSATIYKL